MFIRKILAIALLLPLGGALCAPAAAEEAFPSRQVTIVVGFAAGGGTDMWARWIAEYARNKWNVPVIVENKPGAGATIAAAHLAKAKPDGYTVALVSPSPFTIAPYFQPVSYDPIKDFTYLFQFLVSPHPLFVKADSPYHTAADLIAGAKAAPGKITWATAAPNGLQHITTLAAFRHEGIDTTFVPFKGGAEAMNALLGGHIDALVAAEFPAYVAAGQIRLLAESGPDRIPAFPELPTYKDLGFPAAVPSFYGLAGPAGMPADAIQRWEELAREFSQSSGFRELAAKLKGTASLRGHDEFSRSVAAVYSDMGKLISDLDMKKDIKK